MRAFNRVLSAFLAAVLIVAGVLTILEICRAALSQPPAVVQWPKLLPKLRSNSYDDAGPILVCVGLAVVGLLILVSGLRRGKPYALPAGSTAPGVRTEINRRSLQRGMRTAVLAIDRVDTGSVTLRRRSARIVARANTPTIDGLDADIRQRIEGLLADAALVDPPRLKIKSYPAPTPPAPTSAQTPVAVNAELDQQPAPAVAQARTAETSTPAAQQVRPPVAAEPAPEADLPRQAASAPKPEPAAAPSKVRSERTAEPKPAPKPTPKSKPEVADPPTARLDDLLESDPGDESR